MSDHQEFLQKVDITRIVAWGSIAYGFGFITVMLHTARLGFPVLELLSAVYIWVGTPLAVVAFFSLRIWRWFSSRARRISDEVRDSWEGTTQGVSREDFDRLSSFLGISIAIFPFGPTLWLPLGSWLKKAKLTDPKLSRRTSILLNRLASFLKGVRAIESALHLCIVGVLLLLAIGLYVSWVYPLIPQRYGGGAPTEVRLLVNAARIPRDILGLTEGDDHTLVTATPSTMKLLYSTANNYYVEAPGGRRMSLSRGVVVGVIWDSETGPQGR